MAAPRDMTTGEIEVLFHEFEKSVLGALARIENNMVTADVFEARQIAYDQRTTRLEQDHQAWVKESTEAHVSLDKDSKARHAETNASVAALEIKMNNRFEKGEERAFQLEQQAKAQKNNKWQAIGIAILASVLGVLSSIMISMVKGGIGV